MNPWIHTVRELKAASEHNLESVFTQANGYLGIRGYPEEGMTGAESDPMQFVAGYFDRSPVTRNTMVNIPTIKRLRIELGGERLDTGTGRVRDYRRSLDLRCAVSERSFTWTSPQNRTTKIRFVSYLSYPRHHLYLTEISIQPVNWTGEAAVEDVFDATGLTLGQKHYVVTGHGDWKNGHYCEIRTLTSRLRAVLACTYETSFPERLMSGSESAPDDRTVIRRMSFPVRRGRLARLRRHAAVVTDFDRDAGKSPLLARAKRCLNTALQLGWRGLRKEQDSAWKSLWDRADVRIGGDPAREFKLRFSIFQMLQAYRPGDPRLSIGAKFLSGEHYSGHYFWDTDIFLTPFYLLTMPEAAQDLVGYRVRNLAGAKLKARSMKFQGAFYPWEACPLDGRENCPEWWKDKAATEPVYIPCGKIELHINAAVAFAASNYMAVAGRANPSRREICRMLVEIARFWVTRGVWENGRFSIKNVIGPDEYHEFVDDNAYTNHTARWSLQKAIGLAMDPETARDLRVSKNEIAAWQKVVDGIELGHASGLLAQDRTFLGLKELDRSKFKPVVPLFRQISMEEIGGLQAIKQADVLALFHQLPFAYDFALMQRCWEYYEPRTIHDSNLSAGSHAVVAALLRRPDDFLRYYDKVLNLDIGGESYNVTDGLHAANAGNVWSATIMGAAGIRWTDNELCCAPQLPAGWKSLGFSLVYRGRRLDFQIGKKSASIACAKGKPVELIVAGRALRVNARAQTVKVSLEPMAVIFDLDGVLVADAGKEAQLPGVSSLLSRLRTAGLRLAVASSSKNPETNFSCSGTRNVFRKRPFRDNTPDLLRQAGLDRFYFDAVADTGDNSKSQADVLLLAASRAGVKPSRCLCVEASPTRIEAARRVGMKTLGVGQTAPTRCDWHRKSLAATSPNEIFGFLARMDEASS